MFIWNIMFDMAEEAIRYQWEWRDTETENFHRFLFTILAHQWEQKSRKSIFIMN